CDGRVLGPEQLLHASADFGRRAHGGNTRGFQRRVLVLGAALAAADDGAGVAHAFARRRGEARNVAYHRLGHVGLDVPGSLFLGGAADLAHHDDALGLRVGLEQLQAVDEGHAVDRVTADAHAGALAEANVGGLLDRLIGQRAGAGDDADGARHVDVARHDADLALTRRNDARAVG